MSTLTKNIDLLEASERELALKALAYMLHDTCFDTTKHEEFFDCLSESGKRAVSEDFVSLPSLSTKSVPAYSPNYGKSDKEKVSYGFALAQEAKSNNAVAEQYYRDIFAAALRLGREREALVAYFGILSCGKYATGEKQALMAYFGKDYDFSPSFEAIKDQCEKYGIIPLLGIFVKSQ